MGEAKQEEVKAAEAKVTEEKKEEKQQEEKKEEKKEEEKKEEEKKEEKEAKPSPPPPPPPVILAIDMHCVGCAKKIERCLLKCKGVEEVETDMAKNQLKIKGVVDPQALCSTLQKKTMRSARVISPLPPPDEDQAADSTKSQVVASQVSGVTTVELHVNMHCEACAQQLRRKILKMRGVQAAETELSSGKVTVTGTMTGDKLVEYIYRRTGKLAKVIPPPPPPPPPPEEEKKPEEEKPPEEKKEEKPAEENAEKKEEEKSPPDAAAAAGEKTEEKGDEAKKEGVQFTGPEEMVNRMMYWNHNGGGNYFADQEADYYYGKQRMPLPWTPVYVIEHHRPPPPPPQLFSDENPNACCIS